MTIALFDRVENTVGIGENAGYQHFLLFPQCFPKLSSGHQKLKEVELLEVYTVQIANMQTGDRLSRFWGFVFKRVSKLCHYQLPG